MLLTAAKVLTLCVFPESSGLCVLSRDTDPHQLMEKHFLSAPCDGSRNALCRNFSFYQMTRVAKFATAGCCHAPDL